jgi:hypothetical protein
MGKPERREAVPTGARGGPGDQSERSERRPPDQINESARVYA